ncbi:MAG: carboxypeptidase regulatory-like domain-containing protein [Candidatus Methylomirabilales bacterium]
MRNKVTIFVLAGFTLGLWALASVPAATAAGGAIAGVVKFAGDPPPAKTIKATKDKKVCGKKPIYDQSLVVSKETKGIQWAVVSLAGKVKGKWDGKGATLDQRGCVFRPHVLVTPPGKFTILNSDRILHNFHSYSVKNPPMNRAQPGFRKKMKVEFKQPEVVKITCDAHPWMAGWIVVADDPYVAVTDEKGNFKIENVPPGTYTLEVWQETLGTAKQQVTVKAGETVKVAFELKKK